MISNVSNATQTQQAAQTAPVNAKPPQPNPKPATAKPQTPNDTVQVSNAALAALQEATETSVQTAKEARQGDNQAQKLLAKQAAAKAVK